MDRNRHPIFHPMNRERVPKRVGRDRISMCTSSIRPLRPPSSESLPPSRNQGESLSDDQNSTTRYFAQSIGNLIPLTASRRHAHPYRGTSSTSAPPPSIHTTAASSYHPTTPIRAFFARLSRAVLFVCLSNILVAKFEVLSGL